MPGRLLVSVSSIFDETLDGVHNLVDELDLDFVAANTLEVVDGRLTGVAIEPIVDAQRKADLLRELAHKEGLQLEQTIAVGDGANDLLMLKSAGRGIAFCAKEVVKSEIACHVDTRDFLEVLPLIDFLE